MSRLAGMALAIGVLAVVALMGGGAAQLADAASYKLCALRQGQKGPCTCEVKGGTPGEFFTVSRSRCRSAVKSAPTAPADETAAAPAQATTPPAAPPAEGASSIETGATSKSEGATAQTAAPVSAASPSANRRLLDVRARGVLNCGINPDLLGFAKRTAAGAWTGIDADFCRAVAAAVLGDAGKVAFVPVETNDRFEALTTGAVDILARNTTWTMDRDVEMALEFAGILYFDGQGFLTSDARGLVSAQQLGGATVCVESGTTSEANMNYYFAAHKVDVTAKSFANRADMLKAYAEGVCEAITGDRSGLFADRAELENPESHAILPEIISKEPLGPVVLQSDREWVEIVRWTLAGLVNAEEVGLDRATATGTADLKDDALRLVEGAGRSGAALGLSKTWLRDAVGAGGNYGELFETNLGKGSPLGMERGINALWKRGGLVYAPPMW